MSNQSKLSITLFFVFITIKLMAQTTIILRGAVSDSLQNPLPFVNIYTQEAENAPIIAFATTDDKGNFVLKTSRPKMFIVKATLLGYEAQPLIFNETDSIPTELRFVMYPKAFVLKETVVRANGKIIEKSDTTTFLADKFRDSTERNLEELLAKLPGIDIDKVSGVISVRGQPIKKILIEGDDLTGRNYQLMSKNLSADVVDKIQVIDKFNENKLLRGIRRSDDKVINITLKENRKNLLFGNAIVGLGNDWRTNNSVNLFSFNKKFKSLTFGNFNTIGNKSDADRMVSNGFSDESITSQQQSLVNDNNTELINIGRTPSVNIGSQSVRFNRAGMLSSHFIVRPVERLQLKGSVSFANDNLQVFTDNEYLYRLSDSTFNLSESNKWRHRPEVWQTHLDAGFDLSEKATIRYKTDVQWTQIKDISTTVANTNTLDNQLINKNLSWYNALDYTRRLSEQKAFLFNAVYTQQQANQSYQLDQSQNRLLPFNLKDTFRSLQQILDKPMRFTAVNGQFLFSKKQQKVALTIGIVQKTQDYSTGLSIANTTKIRTTPANFENNASFQQTNYYTSLNLKDQFGGVNFFTDISGGYYKLRYNDVFLGTKSKEGFYALPVLGFKKEKEKSSFFGTYAYNLALPQLADVFGGNIVSDYRSIQRGSNLFIPANSHTAILNATYGKFSDNFMCYANLIGTTTQHGYRDKWQITPYFNTSEKVGNNLSNQNLILSSGIEYFNTKLSVRFKVRPSFSANWYQNTLNNSDLRKNQSLNSAIDLSIRSGYLGWFNYHFGTTLTLSNVKTEISSINISNTQNTSIGSFLDFYLKFSERIRGSIETEVFRFRQYKASPQYYSFINSSLSYEVTRSRVYLTLTGRNLLNTKEFVNSYISDFSTQINRVRLLPRYVLLEVNFRF